MHCKNDVVDRSGRTFFWQQSGIKGGATNGRQNTLPSEPKIDFAAPAMLRKWPSLNNERIGPALGSHPYLIVEGSLGACIAKFLAQPPAQRHLYEIHTAPQGERVTAILSADHITELARLISSLAENKARAPNSKFPACS